ncbi:hypothetical protein RAS1_15660 [Phycisphaerae bacterium RAS1]|nr:hypothetical protein RAS1_15660 [Phycisphaerae bacterium RAS1]
MVASAKPNIQVRTFAFAARILKLVRALPTDAAGKAAAYQLARAGTSVGANVEEAQGSHSKAEFVRRMNIARSEAREALYWLRLVAEIDLLPKGRLSVITDEAEQIVRILVSIVKTARSRPA